MVGRGNGLVIHSGPLLEGDGPNIEHFWTQIAKYKGAFRKVFLGWGCRPLAPLPKMHIALTRFLTK
jgi:hypothetical protein